jgi:hypothetical protein
MTARFVLVLSLLCAAAARADEPFTKALSPEDFAAAGLGKLSPEELARLDALVAGRQSGAVAKATEDTTKKVAATVREQVQAEDFAASQKKASSSSFLDKFKVVLKPGTEIEYTTLDAVLVPGFSGYQKGTMLELTNGQRWIVTDNDSDYESPTNKPVHVRIIPGSMGSFFMEIEGSGRPRVKYAGGGQPTAGK